MVLAAPALSLNSIVTEPSEAAGAEVVFPVTS